MRTAPPPDTAARFGALAAAQGVRAVGPLLTLPLAAHALDHAAFGRLATCLAAAQAVAIALDGGISSTGYALVRASARPSGVVFRHLTTLKLAAAILLGAVVMLVATRIRDADIRLVGATWGYGAALSLNGFWLFNHRRASRLALASEALPVMALLAGAGAVAAAHAPVWTMLLCGAVGAVVAPLALAVGHGASGSLADLRAFVRDELRPLSQLGVGLTRLMIAGYTVALTPVAAWLFGLREVAVYTACDRLASVAGMGGLIAAQALAPAVARDGLGPGVPWWRGAAVAGALVLPAYLVGVFGAAGPAVALVYGPGYAGLGGGVWPIFLADLLVGLNTVIWSGVLLPLDRRAGFAAITVVGATACYAVLLAPLHGGYVQVGCARLAGEAAILILSIGRLLPLRPRAATARYA